MAKIHAALVAIQADIGSVEKGRKNTQQGYAYRGIDDLYAAVQVVMATHNVHAHCASIVDGPITERAVGNGKIWYHQQDKFLIRFVHAEDESYVDHWCKGEATDNGDKLSGKVTSYAYKNALITKFLIPTWDPAQDVEAHDVPDSVPKSEAPKQVEPASSNEPQPTRQEWEALVKAFEHKGVSRDKIRGRLETNGVNIDDRSRATYLKAMDVAKAI